MVRFCYLLAYCTRVSSKTTRSMGEAKFSTAHNKVTGLSNFMMENGYKMDVQAMERNNTRLALYMWVSSRMESGMDLAK